ncbi:MASE1 domain-containing protein, partial [Pseudomonas aeruginosa]
FTPLWFPTAAAIAVLYRHAPRHWGLPLLASGLGIVLASFLLFGVSATPVKLAAINLLEAAVCALLLRRMLHPYDPLNDLASWLRFVVCAVIFTPLFSA